MTENNIAELEISKIKFIDSLYPRIGPNLETIMHYRDLKTPAPAIIVNQDFILIDGEHRKRAASERGELTIRVIIIQTRNEQHILDLAVEYNYRHGVPLSKADMKRLAFMRYKPELGGLTQQKQAIADWLHLNRATVYRWFNEADHRRRAADHDDILTMAAQNLSQNRIAMKLGCSKGKVNRHLRSISRKCDLLTGLPSDFKVPLYDVWSLNHNSEGVDHYGKCDPTMICNLIYCFAPKPDDAVLDLFAGSGTVIDECKKWNRACLAYDRLPRPIRGDLIRKHDVILDGLLPDIPNWDDIKLVFLDPPYGKQAEGRYSNDPTDLGNVSLDEFENTLVDLINALGQKLSSGAAIALLIRATQWNSGPEHTIRDHPYEIRRRVDVTFKQEVLAPLAHGTVNPTMTAWARENREWLVISRKLMIWRV